MQNIPCYQNFKKEKGIILFDRDDEGGYVDPGVLKLIFLLNDWAALICPRGRTSGRIVFLLYLGFSFIRRR